MKKIFVNGTFDVVHFGHISLLKSLKGESRPINSLFERMTLIRNLKWVDDVVAFGTDEELESIISSYEPDITLRGSDHKNAKVPHGVIQFFPRLNTYSSTSEIEKIKKL
jgi:D-beta-D-heptose 7-phosphate kinase/D-beta-D-heptose 1-phosphate adenosyltransferase